MAPIGAMDFWQRLAGKIDRPSKVALVNPATLDLMIGGRAAGKATLPAGTLVRVLAVESGKLRIQGKGMLGTVAVEDTDFAERQAQLRQAISQTR